MNGLCWNDDTYPYTEIEKLLKADVNYTTFGVVTKEMKTNVNSTDCGLCKTKFNAEIRLLSFTENKAKRYILNTDKYRNVINLAICDK